MAPRRPAPPPPPPPPAASSEEIDSGSGSDDESEVALSPPPSVVSKNPPPGEESETSDEEDKEEEEEEEEEEGGESAESDQAPPPKPAAKEEDGDPKSTTSNDAKKPFFQRTWSEEDEVRILEALAAHRREHVTLPQPDALFALLDGRLDNRGCNRRELQRKVVSLRRKYELAAKKPELPAKDRDLRLFNLSKTIWPADSAAAAAAEEDVGARRELSEMCELYPFLAEEVEHLEAAHTGMFKRDFGKVEDDRARAIDAKIKKQRMQQMTVELRAGDLVKEVTKALIELIQ